MKLKNTFKDFQRSEFKVGCFCFFSLHIAEREKKDNIMFLFYTIFFLSLLVHIHEFNNHTQ